MVSSQFSHRPSLRPFYEAHVTVTAASYAAKSSDRLIGVNRSGAVTITFPIAELRYGRCYTVKDESGAATTNNITVATEGAETIDGSATDTISENFGAKSYYSDGTNWFTAPLLSFASHTLASHSAKAHSDLTGVGSGDHHAQSHTLDSHTGTLQHEKGGLESDVSVGDGFVEIKSGSTTVIKSNTGATAAPGATDDSAAGYTIGSVWIDTTNDKAYVCLDGTASAAVWTEITATGSGLSQATQSAIEAETNEDTYTPPDLMKHSPGVAKAWVSIAANGSLESPDYGISTVEDTGTGDRDVNFTTAFSSAVFAASGIGLSDVSGNTVLCSARTTADMRIRSYANDSTDLDSLHSHIIAGDQ